MLKIVFMGTPEFAVPSLEACLNFERAEVAAVFTQPDRPKGRGKKLTEPPVKARALRSGIPVYQPDRIKSNASVEILRKIAPDLIVVVAYGQLLSEEILRLPVYGCINVHASLLPKLRGASPIQWSIVSGEKKTGITTMQMDLGLDEGDILLQKEIELSKTITGGALHDLLMVLGAEILTETLTACLDGMLNPIPQDHDSASYAPKIEKRMAEINWFLTAEEISAQMRGFDPWPACITTIGEMPIKLFRPEIISDHNAQMGLPGTIVSIERDSFVVATGKGLLRVKELQMPGSRRMSVSDYLLGHTLLRGTQLKNREV